MRRVDRLKREAREAAEWRRHRLTRWHTVGVGPTAHDRRYPPMIKGYFATCRYCGKGVNVIPNPMPNEIDVSGEAVALNCKP